MNLQELLKSFEGKKSSGGFNDIKFFSLKDDGDKATVKVYEIDDQGRGNLTMKDLVEPTQENEEE